MTQLTLVALAIAPAACDSPDSSLSAFDELAAMSTGISDAAVECTDDGPSCTRARLIQASELAAKLTDFQVIDTRPSANSPRRTSPARA